MLDEGIQPNVVTFGVFIDELCKKGRIDDAVKLFDSVGSKGCRPDVVSYTILVDGFCFVDRINAARELFVSMGSKGCRPNIVSYTILINWYSKRKRVEEAMNLYEEIILKEVRPTIVTYTTLLTRFFLTGENRCVNMIAHLFNAPVQENDAAVGVGTIGSSEAVMLAGLAFKRKWQQKRKSQGKPYDKPNIVTGANVQVCWEKFARYFEVELKEVKLTEGYYVMDPEKAVEMADENTICVAAILESTLTGDFEDVKWLNELLNKKNEETGWDTPIHVDAASGGFIAPFLYPALGWDFRLPPVKSMNVSGHKHGLVYAGVGWVVWRSKDDLPDDLIFHINYLGSDQPTFTLNFSKGLQEHYGELPVREGLEKTVVQHCLQGSWSTSGGLCFERQQSAQCSRYPKI